MFFLGIVYAHRNEDIVNNGPGMQGTMEMVIPCNDSLRQPCTGVAGRKRREGIDGKENIFLSMDQKRIQYSLLAKFMGMGELEFSKWVVSTTPLKREKVLQDYKKRKEKMPNNVDLL